jgi:predicted PurR-regulated permease PerM
MEPSLRLKGLGVMSDFGPVSKALLLAAAAVVVIAGLKLGGPIIAPLLLAACIAVATAPIVGWLERKRVPPALAVATGILCALGAVTGFLLILSLAASDFTRTLPALEGKLVELEKQLVAWLGANKLERLSPILSGYDPGASAAVVFESAVLGASRLIGVFGVVLFVVIFMLLEAPSFRDKLRCAFGFPPERLEETRRVIAEVQHYLVVKTALNAAAGLAAGGWCYVMGLQNALLWGVVAFVLHFIPVFGSVISAIPPLLAALVLQGPGAALGVLIGYLVFNNVIGNIIEPKVMGHNAGLSALVVTVSIVVWGWIFGPVGALLSVPLTMIARIACTHFDGTQWLAVLLGPGASEGDSRTRPKAPSERPVVNIPVAIASSVNTSTETLVASER